MKKLIITEEMVKAGVEAIAKVAAETPYDQPIEDTWTKQAKACIKAALAVARAKS